MNSPALSSNPTPTNSAAQQTAAGPNAASNRRATAAASPCGPRAQKSAARQAIIWAVVGAALLLVLAALWLVDPAEWHVPVCGLYRTTGFYCPGCGATRATHELLHGRLLAALHENALWVLGLPLVVYAAASEVCRQCWGRALPGDLTHNGWVILGAGILVVLFGVLRNLPWEPFTWLAP